jgi:hypothetical protein
VCTQCDPSDPGCIETEEVKTCDANGVCTGTPTTCGGTGSGTTGDDGGGENSDTGDDGGTWDPCAGKACGDACMVCPPNDPECVETGEEKACDPSGECVSDSGDLCGDGDGSSGDGDGTSGDGDGDGTTAGCTPVTMDSSAIDEACVDDGDCPAGYTCQGFNGFVFVQSCQILCNETCERPSGLSCITVSDKLGSWTQCGQ